MAYKTVFNGVIFIEGSEPDIIPERTLNYEYGSIGSQLKNLNDVKANLSEQAKFYDCNCIMNFKYGQKSSWISFDDVKWYGSGDAARISDAKFKKYIDEILKR